MICINTFTCSYLNNTITNASTHQLTNMHKPKPIALSTLSSVIYRQPTLILISICIIKMIINYSCFFIHKVPTERNFRPTQLFLVLQWHWILNESHLFTLPIVKFPCIPTENEKDHIYWSYWICYSYSTTPGKFN